MALLDDGNDLPFSVPAEPGFSDTFVERLSRATPRAIGEAIDLTPYVYRQTRFTENANASALARESSYDALIDTVRRMSGDVLENPERGGYTADARRLARQQADAAMRDAGIDVETAGLPAFRRQAFESRLKTLTDSRPDLADAIAGARIDFSPEMIARRSNMELDARSAGASLAGTLMAGLAGGGAAAFEDPIQVGSMLMGGGPGTARSALVRIGQVALRESAINAGAVAISQPEVQAWRNQVGLASGLEPALENVGMAALLGGAFGGTFGAIGEAFRAVRGVKTLGAADRAAVERVLDGTASGEDVARALDAAGVPRTPELDRELATLQRVAEVDGELARVPEGTSPVLHDQGMADALRYAEAPDQHPPPDLVLRAGKGVTDDTAMIAVGRAVADAQARSANPDLFGRIDTLESRQATARGALDQLTADRDAFKAAPPALAADRMAQIEAELGRFTGKRRSSPKAVALREEFAALRASVDEVQAAQVARFGERETVLRLELNDLQQQRAGLGPEVRSAYEAVEPLARDWRAAVEALRVDPALVASALSSADEALVKAGQLAALSDAVWARVVSGEIVPDVAVHIVGRTLDPAEQAALAEVLRGAQAATAREVRPLLAEAQAAMNARDSAAMLQGRAPEDIDTLAPRPGPPEPRAEAGIPASAREGAADAPPVPAGPRPLPADVLDARATVRDDGTVQIVAAEDLARAGERERLFGDLVASCKV